MMKKLFAMLLMVALALVLATVAFADPATSVRIGDVVLTDGQYLEVHGNAATYDKPQEDVDNPACYAYFKNGVLTLQRFEPYEYSLSGEVPGILYADGDLKIKLTHTSHFGVSGIAESYTGVSAAIYVTGDLEIEGDYLEAINTAGSASSSRYGIYAGGKLKINYVAGIEAAAGNTATGSSIGICSKGDMVIANTGILRVRSGQVNTNGYTCGIKGPNITIDKSGVDVRSGNNTLDSTGISAIGAAVAGYPSGKLIITGGSTYTDIYVQAGGGSNTQTSSGMQAGDLIQIDGGIIEVAGGQAHGYSSGMGGNTYCKLVVNGGKVTAVGGNAGTNVSSGYQGGHITLNGGSLTLSGDDSNYGRAVHNEDKSITINAGTFIAQGGNHALTNFPNVDKYSDYGAWVDTGYTGSNWRLYGNGDVLKSFKYFKLGPAEYVNVRVTTPYDHRGTVQGGGNVMKGQWITVKANPINGSTFKNWTRSTESGNQMSTQTTYSFYAYDSVTLCANFTPKRYWVELTDGHFSGEATTTTGKNFEVGEYVTVYANSKDGYLFEEWSTTLALSDTDLKEKTLSFKMPAKRVTLVAKYKDINDHSHAPCGYDYCTGSSHPSHNDVEYKYWNVNSDLTLQNGNNYYYLASDIYPRSSIAIRSGQTLYLCLHGNDVSATLSSAFDSVFSVSGTGKLILCDCKGGGRITSNRKGRGIAVDGGTVEMYSGSIYDNAVGTSSVSENGGGVYLEGGKFTMYDGEIANNETVNYFGRGGGVCVTSGGEFTMHGGRIGDNIARYGGGIYSIYGNGNAKVNITGGTIDQNIAREDGGGVYLFWNHPVVDYDTNHTPLIVMSMSGGYITDNTAYGKAGGLYNDHAGVEISGGYITGNKAESKNGSNTFAGGIYNCAGILYLNGGTIKNNKAESAGGIGYYCPGFYFDKITVSGNVTVTDNTDLNNNVSNVELPSGAALDISGALSGSIGVYTKDTPAKNAPVRYLKPVNGYTLTASDLAHTAADRTGTYFVKNIDREGYGIFGNMQYKVTVSNDGNGTGTANYTLAENGTEITLTPSAKEGYTFKEWQVVKGDVTVANNKFTMGSADVEIKAVFEAVNPDYTVSITTPNNGTVTADVATAKAGATVTLTVTPNVGYVVDSVKYNDTTITPVEGVYSFTMPAANVTVTATFKPIAPVANVDGIDYTNFADAVNAWQQSTAKTMTLLADAALDEANIDVIELLYGDKKVLDLNGCSLSNKSGSVLYISNFISMEIMDSVGSGVIAGKGDNATIQTAIGSLRITGGTIESDHCAIYNDNSGSLSISGKAVIKNTHTTSAAIISAGGMTISDKVTIDAEVDISIEGRANLEYAENCAGWHLKGKSTSLFLPTNYCLMTAVSNGTYVTDLSKVDSAYIVAHEHKYSSNSSCTCGAPAISSVTINGETTYYGAMRNAVSACVDGCTLKLLRDINTAEGIRLTKTMIFDLGGYTLDFSMNGKLYVDNAAITLKNGTLIGGINASVAITVNDSAKLTVQDCTVQSRYNFGVQIVGESAKATFERCTIQAPTAAILTKASVPVIKADVYTKLGDSIRFIGAVSGIDLKDANQPEYTVRFDYKEANCTGLDLNSNTYELVHQDGTPVSAEQPISNFNDVGIIRLKHVHSWSYEANGNTITAKCTGNIGTCPDSEQTISVVAPAVLVYSGDEKTAAIEGSIEGVELPVITYNNVDRTKVTGNEIEASIQLGTATASVQYTIVAATIEAAVVSDIPDQVYTGAEITPKVSVKIGEQILVKDTDYTVEYTDNINVGEATVTVNGMGNYAGTVEAKFQISKSDADVAAKSYLGETEQSAFFYGDVITVKGSAAVAQTFALRAPTDKARLYFNGILLAEGDVSGNSFTLSYDTTEKKLPVDTHTLTVEFGGNGNLNGKAVTVTVTLNKAAPNVSAPTGLSATYGQTLADITLPPVDNGAWSWKEDITTQVGNAGEQTYVLVFTPKDSDSSFVNVAEVNANITVSPLELKSVTAPSNVELTSYHATAEEVKNQLPATITVTGADNKTYKLPVTWTCDPFNDQPNGESTFTWTAELGDNFTATDVATTGIITVTNGSALSVTITGTNQETTYKGNSYNVSGMFTIDPNAGAATYAIVEGGTGAGTLEGAVLTITKAGTITIKVSTAQKLPYAAGEASATLTVDKGELSVEPLTNLTAVYGDTLSAVALPENWAWKTPETKVGDVGDRVHIAVYNTDPNLWNDKEVSLTIKVNKASIQMDASAKTFLGEVEQTTFTYGDVITVKVTPVMPMLLSDELVAPAPNQMALFYGSQQISSPVDAVNGTYTMEYATTDKVLPTGESKLTVRYVGNGNTNDASSDLPVIINPKTVTLSAVKAVSRAYDPSSLTVGIESATLEGVLNNDDVAVDTLALQATINKADAGTYTEVLLPEPIKLIGTAAQYYKATGGRIAADVTITKAALTPAGTPNLGDVMPGTPLGDVPTGPIEELFKPVEGTVTWKDPAETPVEPGKEYEWTFTPVDPNYDSVTDSVVIIPNTSFLVTVVNGTGSGEYKEGDIVNITANAPAVGKQFAGWTSNEVTFVNANTTTTSFTMPAKVVTVVANYIDVPVSVHYTVVYNANGGTGVMANQYFNSGETKALLPNVFTREGYTFKGWNTKPDGTGTAYADGQVVTMYSAAILYAQWMPVEAPVVPTPTPTPTPDPVVIPLEITQQPTDQMVAPGEKAQFSIVANGDGVTYQWYINRNDGRGWVKLQGATNAVHEISAADLAYDGFQYACEVRDIHGNVVRSQVAVLYVAATPEIPETGDATNLPMLSAMLLLSFAGCLLLVNRKRMAN